MQEALNAGIIEMSDIEGQLKVMNRKKLLEKHPYSIWQGKDGKWYTHLPDKARPSKRRMVKKSTQESLENEIVKFYKKCEEKEKVVTFDNMYFRWRESQDKLVSGNTIAKYNTDYKRYFEKTEFAQRDISSITEEDIKVFICSTVKQQSLCKKACKTLFGYINNVFKSARINHVFSENPMEFLEPKQFYKYCTEKKRTKEQILVSDAEMRKLYGQFQKDYEDNPEYIPTYAVELASLTGMRVGELSALTWDCITDACIVVNKSEKYDRLTKKYFIDTTKNEKERSIPITDEIRNLLNRVKRAEIQLGYICEWVFANKNGRIHAPVISSCSKNKCRQVDIHEKGIHAYRRTVNSKMRCSGVSATVAASMLGHSEAVNEQYYTFDITGMEEKRKIISKINAEMPITK